VRWELSPKWQGREDREEDAISDVARASTVSGSTDMYLRLHEEWVIAG
jgi:hypothetical protein